MSPAEKALVARINRRAATLAPAARKRLFVAFDLIQSHLSESELLRAANTGQLDRLLDTLLSDEELDKAFRPLKSIIDRASQDSSALFTKDLPSRLAGVFDILNPRVLTAIGNLDTRVIQGLKDEVRETVRQAARAGLESGVHPREVARGIRGSLGLAPNQEAAVRNFRRLLIEGDREALTRALRDRRFDRTLSKALGKGGVGLSKEQVEKMTEAYRKRMVAFNAETHARTIALDAMKLAQRNSWEDAIARGVVDPARLRRIWQTVGDDRVRPSHMAMHGQVVLWGQRWSNGQDIPGDTEYNCRCLEKIVLVPVGQKPPVSPLQVTPPTPPAPAPTVVAPSPAAPVPPVLPTFNSSSEAAKWLKTNGYAADVSMPNWDTPAANQMARALYDARHKYNLHTLDKIAITNADGYNGQFSYKHHWAGGATGGRVYSDGVLTISRRTVTGADAYVAKRLRTNSQEKYLTGAAGARRWGVSDNVYDLTMHEVGHALHYRKATEMFMKMPGTPQWKALDQKYNIGQWGYKGDPSHSVVRKEVLGEYSFTNTEEYVAESFAAWTKGWRVHPDMERFITEVLIK